MDGLICCFTIHPRHSDPVSVRMDEGHQTHTKTIITRTHRNHRKKGSDETRLASVPSAPTKIKKESCVYSVFAGPSFLDSSNTETKFLTHEYQKEQGRGQRRFRRFSPSFPYPSRNVNTHKHIREGPLTTFSSSICLSRPVRYTLSHRYTPWRGH